MYRPSSGCRSKFTSSSQASAKGLSVLHAIRTQLTESSWVTCLMASAAATLQSEIAPLSNEKSVRTAARTFRFQCCDIGPAHNLWMQQLARLRLALSVGAFYATP